MVRIKDKRTTDANIKFVNKGQKFKNKNGAIVEVISDVDKLGQVTFKIKAPTQTFPDSATVKVDGLINMLNKNGYTPTKDAKTIDNLFLVSFKDRKNNGVTQTIEVQAANKDLAFKKAMHYFERNNRDVVVIGVASSYASNSTGREVIDAPYFDPMYKDTRRAIVKEAEKYLSSKGLNNSVGKYDKAIFGVRNLLEKTLLQPGTDKFNEAVHREVDRLLKKYNLTEDREIPLSKMDVNALRDLAVSLGADKNKLYGTSKQALIIIIDKLKSNKINETKDREPLEVIAEKNGYGLAINEKGILVLKFPGESYSNPHMYLGKYNGPWDKNYGKALNMFEKFAKIKAKDAANGSVDDYLKKMNNKTQAEVEKILKQAKGNPNADKAYKIWKSTVKDADHVVLRKGNGYELGYTSNSKGEDIIYFAFPGESYRNPHMYLGKYDGAFGSNYMKALKMAEEFIKLRAKDEEPKTYSYSIKIGGDLKKVRVKANNSDEALAKVKAEAIKFKADRVKTKWDNNKLSTRDQD